jgi:polysaccharide export outer membrane protein
MRIISSFVWSGALLGATLAGCVRSQTVPPAEPAGAEYRLGREDVVEVSVWKDPALSATVPVRPDGRISVPLLGDVRADGRTASELRKEIAGRLRPMVKDPVVAIIAREVNAPKLYIVGEVARPGVYPMRTPLTVVQAVARAGGFTEFADRGGITFIRPNGTGERRFRVRYADAVAGRNPTVLAAGDTIVVP